MQVEHNASRALTILVTTALLLNAMMPTLAHAATYLQGTEVNANTLVQDAYVAVTYYDSKGKQKLEKGWIDAVGETSFTIREGGFRGNKTIAYDKVLSLIMSEESTVPAKQMNEVNRFPKEKKREMERAKKEEEEVRAKVEQAKREARMEQEKIEHAMREFKQETVLIMPHENIDPSKITQGWYAHVIYTSKEGAKRTITGRIVNKDATGIMVKVRNRWDRTTDWTIAYDNIDILVVSKRWSDIERYRESGAKYNMGLRRDERKGDIKTRPTVARKIGTGLLTGGLSAIAGGFTGLMIGDIATNNCEGDLCGLEVLAYMGLGMAMGYMIGVPIGVSRIDPHDRFLNTMLGSLLGAGAGIAITSANNEFAMSLVIFPLIGATIMSEQSRDTYENRRFSVGLAPVPDGNVRAIATLRF